MDLRISEDEDDEDSESEEEADELDPIAAERRRRKKAQDRLRARAGEPVKPDVAGGFEDERRLLSYAESSLERIEA